MNARSACTGEWKLLIALEEMWGLTVTVANLSSCYFVFAILFLFIAVDDARVNKHIFKHCAAKTTVTSHGLFKFGLACQIALV